MMEGKSKQKTGFPNAKRKPPSEAEMRMNFLMKAANLVLETTGNPILAAAYSHHAAMVGQKGQIRLHRDVKRTVCKGCHGLLVPGKTARTQVNGPKKQKKLQIVCKVCSTQKSFLLEENRNKEKKKEALEKKKKLKQEALENEKKLKKDVIEKNKKKGNNDTVALVHKEDNLSHSLPKSSSLEIDSSSWIDLSMQIMTNIVEDILEKIGVFSGDNVL